MRPMSRIALLAAVAFAALTGTAHAGGWATVELGETPSGLVAGEPWRVELIVKQHGLTPLEGVVPSVRIDNGEGVVKTFTARPTDRVGTYVADIDFPAAIVFVSQPGAAPNEMETQVTQRVESAIRGITSWLPTSSTARAPSRTSTILRIQS